MPALILGVVMIPQASSVPLEDALDKGQAQNDLEMHRPWDEAPPLYYDINPHMSEVSINHTQCLLISSAKLIINY
ncbi:MAG: hypothetical protein CM1200mP16_15560 [Nitrospina sp.]|nr:MAG: hypothetical protein CM1200mP16_15560 [Nitrospina sp.]